MGTLQQPSAPREVYSAMSDLSPRNVICTGEFSLHGVLRKELMVCLIW